MIDVLELGPDDDVAAAVFDEATDTWLLKTLSGNEIRARVVVDGLRTLHHPPKITDEFAGPSFHWSRWDPALEPAGGRVAVIGDRAAHVVSRLTEHSLLFGAPSSLAAPNTKHRLHFRPRSQRNFTVVTSPVDRITRSGIRTADGTEHAVDTIIYATASVCSAERDALVGTAGQTIQHAWRDGAEAYLGLAVRGFPNYFLVGGPDSPVGAPGAVRDGQLRYIAECLQWMRRHGGTRVEVRHSAQRQFIQRARVTPPRKAFERGSETAKHVYDGQATLTIGSDEHAVRVRLTGHLDPIDGKYHWQGMVFGTGPLRTGPTTIATDDHVAQARITEQTPWGSYAIAGVGEPPFTRS